MKTFLLKIKKVIPIRAETHEAAYDYVADMSDMAWVDEDTEVSLEELEFIDVGIKVVH